MRTSKPISTISYNTTNFLKAKLDHFVTNKIISFYCFIEHLPEDDEAGNKKHIHLYIEPSKMVQTDDLRQELKEIDLNNINKPLGVLPFRSSDFGNWYLYSIHDTKYLAMKGQSRRYHYKHDDIITSDSDFLLCLSRSIDMLNITPYAKMQEAQEQGLTFDEYFSRGIIPIQQIKNFQLAWQLLAINSTYRGGRIGHE